MIHTLARLHALLLLLLLLQGSMRDSFSLEQVPELEFEEIDPMPKTLNYLEQRFKVYFDDYPITNIKTEDYCNQMVKRKHVMNPLNLCKPHHYFFHLPWFALENICEHEKHPCLKQEGNCHLTKKLKITHCKLTAGVTYPNCVYSTQKENKPLLVRCVEAMGLKVLVPVEVETIVN